MQLRMSSHDPDLRRLVRAFAFFCTCAALVLVLAVIGIYH
jgi:hypothetical protein